MSPDAELLSPERVGQRQYLADQCTWLQSPLPNVLPSVCEKVSECACASVKSVSKCV